MKITINTSEVVNKVTDKPFIAPTEASCADLQPESNRAFTASTTTIESSTTVPITSTNAKSVSKLMEKPATFINANVPTSETIIPMAGIIVARKSCKKKNTTTSTSRMAIISVSATSRIDAKRKSLVLSKVTILISLGNVFSVSSINLSISRLIFVAFEPAI